MNTWKTCTTEKTFFTNTLKTCTTEKAIVLFISVYFSCKFLDFVPGLNIFSVYIVSLLLVMLLSINRHFSFLLLDSGVIAALTFIFLGTIIISRVDLTYYWHTIDNLVKILIIYILFAYLKIATSKYRKWIIKIAFYGFFITMLTTLVTAVIDSAALRDTASIYVASKIIFGFGGFDFIYGLVILNVILVNLLLKKQILQHKWFILTYVVLNTLTIMISGYTTALLLNFAFLFISYLFGKHRSIAFYLVICMLIIGGIIALPYMLLQLSELPLLPEIVKERLVGIAQEVGGSGNSHYLSGGERAIRFGWSLNLFLQHPLLGNLIFNKDALYGMHAEWIDRLAQYGIMLSSLLLLFWVRFYKKTKEYLIRKGRTLESLRICFLYFFVLGFLNPATYALTVFPLLIFLPFIDEIFLEDKSENV